jgi:hypothetical protein
MQHAFFWLMAPDCLLVGWLLAAAPAHRPCLPALLLTNKAAQLIMVVRLSVNYIAG